jgi:hypothetical protein
VAGNASRQREKHEDEAMALSEITKGTYGSSMSIDLWIELIMLFPLHCLGKTGVMLPLAVSPMVVGW